MLKDPLLIGVRPGEDAVSVYPVPAFSIDRSGNVATPEPSVCTATVPDSFPEPGLFPSDSATEAFATATPKDVCTVTVTAGLIVTAATALLGPRLKASRLLPGSTTVTLPLAWLTAVQDL